MQGRPWSNPRPFRMRGAAMDARRSAASHGIPFGEALRVLARIALLSSKDPPGRSR
jgi:hypothetical protein